MKASELRKKSVDELQTELNALCQERFNLRMQNGFEQTKKPHLTKANRRNIAKIKTVMREKQNERN